MSQYSSVTGKALISSLKKIRFEVVRVRGSHHFLRHEDGRAIVWHKVSDRLVCLDNLNRTL